MKKAIATILALAGGCSTVLAADAKAGQESYNKACKSCHGTTGAPNPAIAKMMKVDMRNLSSPEVQGESDAEMKKIVMEGKGKMKPVKTLSGGDIDNVIAWLRTLKK